MKKTLALTLTGLFVLGTMSMLGCGGTKEEITIAGGGPCVPIVRELAKAYMAKNKGATINVPESIGTGGGIKSAADGSIQIGMVARKFKPAEGKYNLEYLPFAKTIMAIAVNNNVDVAGLTSDQFNKIYSGEIANWKEVGGQNAKIIVFTREEAESLKMELRRLIPGFSGVKETTMADMRRSDQDMNQKLSSTKNSIAWTTLGSIKAEGLNVKPLSLDGIEPNVANARSGSYKLLVELAFVYSKTTFKGLSKHFMDFVFSEKGQEILEENGYLPVVK